MWANVSTQVKNKNNIGIVVIDILTQKYHKLYL